MAFVTGIPVPTRRVSGAKSVSPRRAMYSTKNHTCQAVAPRKGNASASLSMPEKTATSPPSFDPALMDPVHERTERIRHDPLTIVVMGASGDLAKKKTFPAIFSLYYHDLLPEDFRLYGFARSDISDDEFRELILGTLSCRVIDGEKCSKKMEEFLPRCFYHRGSYAEEEDFRRLDNVLTTGFEESHKSANRLYYLAIPPKLFYDSSRCINSSSRARKGWTRVVVEKPFGHDSESYRELRGQLSSVLHEDEMYRIDHFLAKVLIQNLMTLRFANSIFEPLWNRNNIKSVQITFKEHFGVEGCVSRQLAGSWIACWLERCSKLTYLWMYVFALMCLSFCRLLIFR